MMIPPDAGLLRWRPQQWSLPNVASPAVRSSLVESLLVCLFASEDASFGQARVAMFVEGTFSAMRKRRGAVEE